MHLPQSATVLYCIKSSTRPSSCSVVVLCWILPYAATAYKNSFVKQWCTESRKFLTFKKHLLDTLRSLSLSLSQYIIKLDSVFIYLCSLLTLFFSDCDYYIGTPGFEKLKRALLLTCGFQTLQLTNGIRPLFNYITWHTVFPRIVSAETIEGGNYSREVTIRGNTVVERNPSITP